MDLNNPFLSINLEILFVFLLIATPTVINIFINPDLKDFLVNNRIVKYIALFLLVYIYTGFYNDYLTNLIDLKHIFWSLLITFLFILINKLNYKYILSFLSITILLYLSIKIYNTYIKKKKKKRRKKKRM